MLLPVMGLGCELLTAPFAGISAVPEVLDESTSPLLINSVLFNWRCASALASDTALTVPSMFTRRPGRLLSALARVSSFSFTAGERVEAPNANSALSNSSSLPTRLASSEKGAVTALVIILPIAFSMIEPKLKSGLSISPETSKPKSITPFLSSNSAIARPNGRLNA
ncbi:hypothetical protein MGSAQ_002777 [marine sediment metagenome]|uniref:Uncharacterized protein n=1 Tax=marine sediment metagenome TaxID=412755 RepID=A0A1B6NQL0_9ZZZZ